MQYEKSSGNKGRLEVGSLEGKFKKFEKQIRTVARSLLDISGKRHASLEVYLVGAKVMEKNVLAFPAPKRFVRPDAKGIFLGEIYLNPDYIETHGENLIYMLVHGFLHLLGYDHMKKNDRMAMERRERALMNRVAKSFQEGVFQ
ncbi:MAG: rRNA maturation RNase YbeY [Patescibacteria group bacterium]